MRKDFALCFNDGYVPYACVTIMSIMQHMHVEDDVHVHIVSDYISENNQQILHKLGNVHIHIIKDGADSFKDIQDSIWGIYTWFRVLLPSILNKEIHKILYLDCDVVVNDSLDELFSIDMANKAVGGCLDIQTYDKDVFRRLGYDHDEKYICAGVLMMNLDKWRAMDLARKIIQFAESNPNKIVFPDQDAINYACQNDKIVFPCRYGVIVPFFRNTDFIKEHITEMDGLMKHPAIVHYAGYAPWVYAKDRSMHSDMWWRTYFSLHRFHKIRLSYWLSILKYGIRYVLSKLYIIKSTNKYSLLSQYYFHPRVNERQVRQLMNSVFHQN